MVSECLPQVFWASALKRKQAHVSKCWFLETYRSSLPARRTVTAGPQPPSEDWRRTTGKVLTVHRAWTLPGGARGHTPQHRCSRVSSLLEETRHSGAALPAVVAAGPRRRRSRRLAGIEVCFRCQTCIGSSQLTMKKECKLSY